MANPVEGPDRLAQWIWCDSSGTGRNVFARFRRQLELDGEPTEAVLCLFADARWRLLVNGAVAAYGPGRFVTAHPIFDRVDIRGHLRAGANDIVVEVWNPGSSSFQIMADSSGGFIAWGSVVAAGHRHSMMTSGDWQAQRSTAWDPLAPSYSFAQGPVEILELGRVGMDAWHAPAVVQRSLAGLEPRPMPPLRLALRPAAGLRLLAAIAADERRLACRERRDERLPARSQRFLYALPIRSRQAQRVRIGLFWGPHWLNGVPLAMSDDPLLGNRQNAELALVAGWNLLYGEPEILTEVWAQHIALPEAADLELGPVQWSPAMLAAEVPSAAGSVPVEIPDLDALGVSWRTEDPLGGQRGHPARELAWDRPGRALPPQLPAHLDAQADPCGWVAVADLGGEFLGHIRLRIEAPAGTVVDIASDERLRSDGLLGMYRTNPFVDSADRIILAGGLQEVELFHPRGGRYVQLAIRPVAAGPVVLHAVSVRDHQVPVRRDGSFTCQDPVFAWTWEASYLTLQACVEDAFLDCPWRERGTYLGDALVETATLAAFSRDRSIAWRSLRLFAQSQLPNGLMQDCAPACNRTGYADFSLIWVLWLHRLWELEGDADAVRGLWIHVQRILASPALQPDPDGLVTPQVGCFLDWGVATADREPAGNACVNAFRIRALACAAGLASAIGYDDEADRLRGAHAAAIAAFRTRLWLPGAGRFARCRDDGDGQALHANVLALAFAIPDEEQEPAVLAHVERGLRDNVGRCLAGADGGYLELYFLSYALEALYRHGRTELAEHVMREHWGHLRDQGAWTIWECLRRGASGAGSLCHAWSTTPARWFHERILGVRPLHAGDPSVMLVAPDSLLDGASGVVPHPAGLITVSWRRDGDSLHIEAQGPPGVELRLVDHPEPAHAACPSRS